MKTNLGQIDRIIRFLIAFVIGILYVSKTISGTLATILLIFAGILLLTSIVSFCPLYTLFGVNTCSIDKKPKP